MRIQKYLSEKGIMSRREAERAILAGKISVNGKVVTNLATQIDGVKDKVRVVDVPGKSMTIALNKPRGIVSGRNRNEGKTIFNILPAKFSFLNAVGRLDKESEGLLLLSDDGIVTRAVTGEDHLIEKEYEVRVREPLKPRYIRKMEEGVQLEDGKTLPAEAEMLGEYAFRIVLKEGRKHQIRRMAAKFGLTILELKRVRIGNIRLGNLRPGEYKDLSGKEVDSLKILAK